MEGWEGRERPDGVRGGTRRGEGKMEGRKRHITYPLGMIEAGVQKVGGRYGCQRIWTLGDAWAAKEMNVQTREQDEA